uniref:C2H2-type domain-containing protein n=1 Tax=Parascaris equorum TaxID=6256 RepID=A0A914S7U7_PAREQ
MEECRVLRMHECQQCGKRFKARGGLQQHLRIHSNDRPYQCHFCPKRFTQKSHVDQHERIHTGRCPSKRAIPLYFINSSGNTLAVLLESVLSIRASLLP